MSTGPDDPQHHPRQEFAHDVEELIAAGRALRGGQPAKHRQRDLRFEELAGLGIGRLARERGER
jgi:hypothetical protein